MCVLWVLTVFLDTRLEPAQHSAPMRRHLSLLAVLALPLALAACGGGGRLASGGSYGRQYTAPGPPGDPWGPYIQEASARFTVPENWIRAVMRQESGGHAMRNGGPITSSAGAMGLMQLMPSTYAMLRDRYGLGNDPYDPHDNIMAGTGYINELYHRYGSPAFLAAYNAGPHTVDLYMAGQASLPNETVNYLASVAPQLGGPPMSGPLAAYADAGNGAPAPAPVYAPAPAPVYAAAAAPVYAPSPAPVYAAAATSGGGCVRDLDAAYDPSNPCGVPPAPVQVAEAAPTAPNTVLWGAGAATSPAAPAPAPMPAAAYPTPARQYPRFALIASAQAGTLPIMAGGTRWGVQVGAFTDPTLARETAENARNVAPAELAGAQTVLGRAVHPDGAVLFRARLVGISRPAADNACNRLAARRWPCLTVPPGG